MKRYRYSFKLCIPYTKFSIEIHTDDSVFFSVLWKMYEPYVFILNKRFLTKTVVCINFNSEYIILLRNGVKNEIPLEKFNAVGQVGSLIRWILEIELPWNLFHGAAVCIQRKTIVFLGASGTGKTTLTAYLTKTFKDIIYLSEDMLLINGEQCSICPYPRSLHLRVGGKQILEDYQVETSNLEKIVYGNYERYLLKQPTLSQDIFSVDCFIKLERKHDRNKSFIEKVKEGRFEMLLSNSFLPTNIKNNIISSLRLSNSLPMYIIQYYNIESIEKILYSLIREL